MKSVSANGVEGFLMRSVGGEYFFRVYKDDGFVDYYLTHSDLCVTITDTDAFFYQDDDGNWLDHSPATLGHEQ